MLISGVFASHYERSTPNRCEIFGVFSNQANNNPLTITLSSIEGSDNISLLQSSGEHSVFSLHSLHKGKNKSLQTITNGITLELTTLSNKKTGDKSIELQLHNPLNSEHDFIGKQIAHTENDNIILPHYCGIQQYLGSYSGAASLQDDSNDSINTTLRFYLSKDKKQLIIHSSHPRLTSRTIKLRHLTPIIVEGESAFSTRFTDEYLIFPRNSVGMKIRKTDDGKSAYDFLGFKLSRP